MSTRDIVLIALFAAIVAALGVFPPLTVPLLGVPVTAQSMGVMLAGSILGARRGALALILFLVLVAVGLPLLAGGRGGLGVLFGPSGGFLLAWPVGAYVVGMLSERGFASLTLWSAITINVIGGIVVVYAGGIPWVSVVADLPLATAATGSAAFMPGDVIKAVAAGAVAVTLKRYRQHPLRTA